MLFQRLVLVLVAGIGEGDVERAHPGFVEARQEGAERRVVGVGAVPGAPAHMHAHARLRHVGERHVERLDMVLDAGEEGLVRRVAEVEVALHGEVRRVDLEQMAARHDELVFRLQLLRQREQIGAIRGVVGVMHDGQHAAGRGRSHESLGEALPLLGERPLERLALRPHAGAVRVVAHLGHRLWRVHDARALLRVGAEDGAVGLRVERELLEVEQVVARRAAAEAAHALCRIGRIARTRLLAVAADVDPAFELPLDDMPGAGADRRAELRRVDRLAVILPDQQGAQRRAAHQTACVRGEDPFVATTHGTGLCRMVSTEW